MTGRTGTRAASGMPAKPRDVDAGGDHDGVGGDRGRRPALDAGDAAALARRPAARALVAHARPRPRVDRARRARRRGGAGRSSGRPRRRARGGRWARARAPARGPGSGAAARPGGRAERRKACSRSSASASSASRATTSVPVGRRPGADVRQLGAERPRRRRRCAGPARAARARRTRPRRRARASRRRRARRRARRRRSRRCAGRAAAARHADARPIGPPPITATSTTALLPLVASLPTPVRPGSGSTVGGPVPPSQPDGGLPLRRFLWYSADDAPRPHRRRQAVPGLRRAAARVPGRGDPRRRRRDPAARQGARRRRAGDRRAKEFRAAADAGGALFVLNDRPDLVAACGADGVHVGQDDMTRADARAVVGPGAIVGRSTHAPEQGAEADADPDVDYLAVGPGARDADQAGPTRRRAWSTSSCAAANVSKPWFAIGGLDAGNVGRGRRAGRDAHRGRARDRRRRGPGGRRARAARGAGGARWDSAAVSGAASAEAGRRAATTAWRAAMPGRARKDEAVRARARSRSGPGSGRLAVKVCASSRR